MSKKIIVAGGGHGGIAAGMLLAKEGFDVTVYEKNKRDSMGYDWMDAFDATAFEDIGIPMPSEENYEPGANITFVPPSENTVISMPEGENTSINMERKFLYNYLIGFAEEAGVKFKYETEIKAPLLAGDRVVGIETEKGKIYGAKALSEPHCRKSAAFRKPPRLTKNSTFTALFTIRRARTLRISTRFTLFQTEEWE